MPSEPSLIRVHSFLYIVVDTDGEPLDVEPVTETLDIEGTDPVPLGHQIRDWLASLSAGLDEAIAADLAEQEASRGLQGDQDV